MQFGKTCRRTHSSDFVSLLTPEPIKKINPDSMIILTDDQQTPISQSMKQNILCAMHWLVKNAQANNLYFFHYYGKTISHSMT